MTFASEVLADAPATWERFGELSGSTAADSSGNGRNAAYVGTSTLGVAGAIVGDSDTACTFSGSSYAQLTGASWMNTTDYTIVVYFKSTVNGFLVSRDDGTTKIWDLQLAGGNVVYTKFSGTIGTNVTSSGTYLDGNWHRVAVIKSGTTVTLRIDGVQDGQGTSLGSFNTSATLAINIARRGNNTGFLAATLDEFAFYGSALSAARDTAQYNAGSGAPVSGTAAAALGGLAASASGVKTEAGTATAPLGGLAASATGVRTRFGTATASLGGVVATATGVRTNFGSANAALGGLTAIAVSVPTGTAVASLGGLAASISGLRITPGIAAAPLGGLTASIFGSRTAIGTASAALGSLTASASGMSVVAIAVSGDAVALWDTSTDSPAVEYRALIETPGTDTSDESPDVGIRQSLVPYLPLGIREPDQRESATLQLEGDEWVIVDIKKKPRLQPGFGGGVIAQGEFDDTRTGAVNGVLPHAPEFGGVNGDGDVEAYFAVEPASGSTSYARILLPGWYSVHLWAEVNGLAAGEVARTEAPMDVDHLPSCIHVGDSGAGSGWGSVSSACTTPFYVYSDFVPFDILVSTHGPAGSTAHVDTLRLFITRYDGPDLG